jgi:hypothetical protein
MSTASPDRMGIVSRMAIEYAREMMERHPSDPGSSGGIEQIDVPVLRLAIDSMSDRAAAREIGEAIYRALLRRMES